MPVIVTYPRMNALCILLAPPRANVPAQRTRPTNAFAAGRGDKAAMRPFVKLLSTLIYFCYVLRF